MRHKSPNYNQWKGIKIIIPTIPMFPLLRFNQSHQMNPIPMYHLLKLMVTPEPPYPHLDAGIKEVKYSDWYQREYAPMRISEEDHHSPNFPLTYNFKLSVRALIELHLLDRKIQTIRRHRIWYVKERQTASGLWLIRLFFYYLLNGGYLASGQVRILEHQRNITKAQAMLPYLIF